MEHFFPACIFLMSVGACCVYAIKGDYARVGYWLGSTLLVGSTLVMK